MQRDWRGLLPDGAEISTSPTEPAFGRLGLQITVRADGSFSARHDATHSALAHEAGARGSDRAAALADLRLLLLEARKKAGDEGMFLTMEVDADAPLPVLQPILEQLAATGSRVVFLTLSGTTSSELFELIPPAGLPGGARMAVTLTLDRVDAGRSSGDLIVGMRHWAVDGDVSQKKTVRLPASVKGVAEAVRTLTDAELLLGAIIRLRTPADSQATVGDLVRIQAALQAMPLRVRLQL